MVLAVKDDWEKPIGIELIKSWHAALLANDPRGMIHPHFESIHPFEDGNGRVGRALVAKTLAEGLGSSLVLPVSTVIDRYRKDYYEAIREASQSLDWTDWARFFIPVLPRP